MPRSVVTIVTILCTVPFAFGDPRPDLPSPMGINGISAFHYRDLKDATDVARRRALIVRDIGAAWDRMDLWWSIVQPATDEWDWTVPDRLILDPREEHFARADDSSKVPNEPGTFVHYGISPLPILCYGSRWKQDAPADEEEAQRWSEYVFRTVDRYKNSVRAWQIWNEPNIRPFWTPEPDPANYARVLRLGYLRAKDANPWAEIVIGPTSGLDLGFLREVYDHGAWNSFDVFAFHPYSFTNGPDVQHLDEIIAIAHDFQRSHGPVRPTWITEIGWRTESLPWEVQAENVLKTYTMALAAGVERVFWFNLVSWEEKWGLVTQGELERKPGTHAYRAISQLANSHRPEGCINLGPGVYAFVWKPREGAGQTVLTAWYRGWGAHHREMEIRVESGHRATDYRGREQTEFQSDSRGTARITLGRSPVVIWGVDSYSLPELVPCSTQPWRHTNLVQNPSMEADSVTDEQDPWHTGHYGGGRQDGTFAWADDPVRSGSRSLRIDNGQDAIWESAPIPVREGKQYAARVYCRTKGEFGRVKFTLAWYNGTMWGYLGGASGSLEGNADRHWQEIGTSGTAPRNAVYARLILASKDSSGSVWFDDAELVETP